MAKGIKVCKVCGKEYEACRTLRPNLDNEFRWQDVACCPAHGAEYLRRVLEARGQTVNTEPPEEKVEAPVVPKKTVRKSRAKKTAE